MQSLCRKAEQQGAIKVESEVFLGTAPSQIAHTDSPFPPFLCILCTGLHHKSSFFLLMHNNAPVFSAVRLELVVELEEGLVSVSTVQVVTLFTLGLRTSD